MFDTRDDWQRLCESADLTVKRRRIRVAFAGGRSHEVQVHVTDDIYLLTAEIADSATAHQLDDPYQDVWLRNRRSRLVGFRIDNHGSLVAHGWTPKEGLTAEAFQLLVRAVAREADRYEFRLTGLDKR
ncbi:YbjN domain-containing protein [Phytohabitans rumicis]|uniref:YbjN domain-containing protein n=1 Tax=Phytohabitans rumicis TaxID=1076125 RepID=A0A6V8L315_9ACTN|nr:hypothetical protein [Phytohabitans rumicis]GFJ89940.1 hypothetical protein Prum_035820 [Phytohabitans rumicis]